MGQSKWKNAERVADREGTLVIETAHVIHGMRFILLPRGEFGPDLAVEHVEDVFKGWLETKDSPLTRQRC